MSPRSSKSESPPSDIYVGLLFVSLASLITGIVFLFLELQQYDFRVSP